MTSRGWWSHRWLAAVGLAAVTAGAAPRGPGMETGAGDRQAVLDSDEQHRDGQLLYARGAVHLRYGDLVIEADSAMLDQATRDVVATGSVVLHERDRRIAGDRLEFNLDTRLGRVWQVWGYAEPEIYMQAAEVEKVGEDSYRLRDPAVTSCNQPTPQWRLRASAGRYEVDRYVRLRNARLEVFGVPLLYLPFFQYPAKRDRSTGFLFPSVGSNNRRGFHLANTFFWAIGRSYDATITHDWYSRRGSLFSGEFRYVPGQQANGMARVQNSYDRLDDSNHRLYSWVHNQRFGRTWSLGADVQIATDQTVEQQWSRDFNTLTQRQRASRAFLARNWSRYSLNASVFHSVRFLGTTELTSARLPSVAFSLRQLQVAGPVYVSLDSIATRFDLTNVKAYEELHLGPVVSVPLAPAPWLTLTPSARYDISYYTRSYAAGSRQTAFSDDPFFRSFGSYRVEMLGPVFNRIFLTPGSFYSDKFKHLIEPVTVYEYVRDGDPDLRSLPGDARAAPPINRVTYSLRNRLLARRSLFEGGQPAPYELLSAEVGMSYSLDPDRPIYNKNPYSRVVGRVRFAPVTRSVVTYDFQLDPDDWYFAQQAVQASLRGNAWWSGLSLLRTRSAERVQVSQLRGNGGVSVLGQRVSVQGSLFVDLLKDEIPQLDTKLVYRTQCCGFGFRYTRLRLAPRDDSEFGFSLSLRNIGSVLDYTIGERGP